MRLWFSLGLNVLYNTFAEGAVSAVKYMAFDYYRGPNNSHIRRTGIEELVTSGAKITITAVDEDV